MNIFLTNDDSIQGKGLITLANVIAEKHNVLVVAPLNQKSACSHALTAYVPQRLAKCNVGKNITAYAFDGTPADCVKFGTHMFPQFKPDIVLSGINKGQNTGSDIMYSGTVAGAREAASLGYKSVALSLADDEGEDFSDAARFTLENLEKIITLDFDRVFWNINFPPIKRREYIGIKLATMGIQIYDDHYSPNVDEEITLDELAIEIRQFKRSYILKGERIIHDKNHGLCDVEIIKQGYVTLTPLVIDYTHYKIFEKYNNKEIFK